MSNVKATTASMAELGAAQRKTAEKKSMELKKLEEKYELTEKQARMENDIRLREIKDNGQVQMMEELDVKEKKLAGVKDNLNKTQEILAQEKERLATNFSNREEERRFAHEGKMQRLHESHTQDGQELNEKFNNDIRQIHSDAKKNETVARAKAHQGATKLKREYDTAISKDYRNFTDQKYNQDVQNFNALDTQKRTFQHEFVTKENTHKSKFASQQIRHETEKLAEEKQHQLTTEQTRLDFEKKYQGILGVQNENMATLDDKVNHNIEKMKMHETKTKEHFTTRAQDKFYAGTTIKTDVQDKGNHYLIKIPLPAHEAAGATLSGKDRNLKFSFSRLSEMEVKLEDGSVNKTKRSESMVKQFQVADIIDPKSIAKEYKDGVVTYKVAKL